MPRRTTFRCKSPAIHRSSARTTDSWRRTTSAASVSGRGRRYYPKSFFSYFRPYFAIERDIAFDGGETLKRVFYSGYSFQGRWGSNGWMDLNQFDERVGSKLLTRRFFAFDVNAAPLRWLPAVQFDGEVGERIDYAGGRVGTGARLNLSGTTRLTDHLEMELRTSREWVDLDGGGCSTPRSTG